MPKKLKTLALTITLLLAGFMLTPLSDVYAASAPHSEFAAQLGNGCVGQTASTCLKNNKIVSRLNEIVNFLSAMVGIVVAGSIIFAGIQYTLAEDNPQKLGAARSRILHSVIALITFLFIYAFLQYIIPGGIFS